MKLHYVTYRSTGRLFVLALLIVSAFGGCASSHFVMMRDNPASPLSGPLRLLSRKGAQPTPRTVQLLRRYELDKGLEDAPADLLGQLQQLIEHDPAADKVYALAEVAYINARKAEGRGDSGTALDRYGESVTSAYIYLVDSRFDWQRNPYDPQFRRACDLYNGALERALRILKKQGDLRPGNTYTVETPREVYDVKVVLRGAWHEEDFGEFEFVSDYEVEGLTNHYHTFGLGVPLIAVRKNHEGEEPAERYYPPQLTFPVTAFLRVLPHENGPSDGTSRRRCVLELFDPLMGTNTEAAGRVVPLETDLSTPLAYFLEQPAYQEKNIATFGLLNPQSAQRISGLYMLQPFDPHKIPVIMVHGLWSSPLTWMEMFNDLRGFPEIRNQYQFWFYLYPTGQPFWISAAQLREDLVEVRSTLDPQRQVGRLDSLVLVGHSMGGLVSKLQTLESRDDYWRIVSDKPFSELSVSPEARESLAKTFFFQPNPSVRRVVTIATPHRGSHFSNSTTQWLGRWLITMPEMLSHTRDRLLNDNPNFFQNEKMFGINNSIESLAPDSPVLPVMLQSPQAPWVKYHNIVGLVSEDGVVGNFAGDSDGVVRFASAHLDPNDVSSEIVVTSDHVSVHRHPRSILEVRRILLDHLAEAQSAVHPNGTFSGPARPIAVAGGE